MTTLNHWLRNIGSENDNVFATDVAYVVIDAANVINGNKVVLISNVVLVETL